MIFSAFTLLNTYNITQGLALVKILKQNKKSTRKSRNFMRLTCNIPWNLIYNKSNTKEQILQILL